jgi:hypothetical protein
LNFIYKSIVLDQVSNLDLSRVKDHVFVILDLVD